MLNLRRNIYAHRILRVWLHHGTKRRRLRRRWCGDWRVQEKKAWHCMYERISLTYDIGSDSGSKTEYESVARRNMKLSGRRCPPCKHEGLLAVGLSAFSWWCSRRWGPALDLLFTAKIFPSLVERTERGSTTSMDVANDLMKSSLEKISWKSTWCNN